MIPLGVIYNHGLLAELSGVENIGDIRELLIKCELSDYAFVLKEFRIDEGAKLKLLAEAKLDEEYYSELKGIYSQEVDERFLYVQADISKKEDRGTLIRKIEAKFNRIDVLVNNAGVAPKIRKDILETSEESYDRVMSINLKGPYFLTQTISK